MSHDALAIALTERGASLTARVLGEMYTHPFWELRYGDHGRKNTETDGSFHVRYVVEALHADDAAVLVTYGRWLRTLLVTRGMCTEHLAENFARLAEAIAELVPSSEPAVALLDEAARALVHDRLEAAELQRATPRLAFGALTALDAEDPPWIASFGPMSAEHRRAELTYLLSYAADAIGMERVDLFEKHLAWLDEIAARHRVAGSPARRSLRALDDVVARDASLTEDTRALFTDLVAASSARAGATA